MGSNWIHRWRSDEDARARLYAIPHVGAGAAAVQKLDNLAPDWLDLAAIRLPGRENRYHEQLPSEMAQVVRALTDALKEERERQTLPTFLLGQCSGAILAFETAYQLEKEGTPIDALIICSRPSPNIRVDQVELQVNDEELLEQVVNNGGFDPAILEVPEMVEFVMPILRQDLALFNNYRLNPGRRLHAPIFCLYGQDDPQVEPTMFTGWSALTTGTYSSTPVHGKHFVFVDAPEAVIDLIVDEIEYSGVSRIQQAI